MRVADKDREMVQSLAIMAIVIVAVVFAGLNLTYKDSWAQTNNNFSASPSADTGSYYKLLPATKAKLRQCFALWMPVEAGAPSIVSGPAPASLDALADEEKNPLETTLTTPVAILLDAGSLKPGPYKIANPWRKYYPDGRVSMMANDADALVLSKDETFAFDVSARHLKLLSHLNTVPGGIDCKRPYGDMTYYYIDMADALGISYKLDKDDHPIFSKEQEKDFEKLHREMLFVVQALIEHGDLPVGGYRQVDGVWRKVSDK